MSPATPRATALCLLLGSACTGASTPPEGPEAVPTLTEEPSVTDPVPSGFPGAGEGGPPDTEPRFGERTTFEATYRIAPSPAGKRLQEVVLLRDDGEAWIRAYRPIKDEYAFQEKRVVVTGRPYTNSPYVQSVGGTHFEVESIALAPGETPMDPAPTELPPPPLARSAEAARALTGWYAVCVGTRDGESFAFAEGGVMPLGPHSSYFDPEVLEGEQSLLAWVDPEGSLHVRAACPGVDPRCGVVDGGDRGDRK